MGTELALVPTMADIERWKRTTYDGPPVLGEDHTRFIIGEHAKTYRWGNAINPS